MKPYLAQASSLQTGESHRRVVAEFFEHWGDGDLPAAGRLADGAMTFFGTPIPASAWHNADERAAQVFRGVKIARIEVVPATVTELLPSGVAGTVFGGALRAQEDQVFFVHTTRAAEVGTVGVVVRAQPGGEPRILRVFDATVFDDLMSELADP